MDCKKRLVRHDPFKNKSALTKRETWQGLDVRQKPDMATHELVGRLPRQ